MAAMLVEKGSRVAAADSVCSQYYRPDNGYHGYLLLVFVLCHNSAYWPIYSVPGILLLLIG